MTPRQILDNAAGQAKSLWQKAEGRFGRRKLIALITILLVLFVGRLELTISGEFQVYPEHNADIRAAVEGLIAEVYVTEGQAVAEGDLIARLDDRDYQARRREAEAELAQKQANLKVLLKGNRQEEVDLAQRELETARTGLASSERLLREAGALRAERISKAGQKITMAEDQLAYAKAELERYTVLKQSGFVSEQRYSEITLFVTIRENELEEAGTDLKLAEAENLEAQKREKALAQNRVEEAEAKLEVILAGTRPEDLEAAEAEVAGLRSQLAYIDKQLGYFTVRSPIDGIVTTERVSEKAGQLVAAGDLIAEVFDFKTIKADIYVPEKEFGDVVLDQNVTLKARAYPGRTFVGVVTAIAPRAVASKDGLNRQMIRVTTEIDNPDLLLKPSMTGNAKIYAGKRSIFELITRRLVRYLRVEFWSWW